MKLSKGFILTFLSTLSWAIGIVIVRYLLKNGANVYNIAFWQMFLAVPYWAFVFIKNKQTIKKISKYDWLPLILLAGVLVEKLKI